MNLFRVGLRVCASIRVAVRRQLEVISSPYVSQGSDSGLVASAFSLPIHLTLLILGGQGLFVRWGLTV